MKDFMRFTSDEFKTMYYYKKIKVKLNDEREIIGVISNIRHDPSSNSPVGFNINNETINIFSVEEINIL